MGFHSEQDKAIADGQTDRLPAYATPDLVPGAKATAMILHVRQEGVPVILEVDGHQVTAVIPAGCFGKSPDERTKAIASLNVGDTIEVVVKQWRPELKSLSLRTPGREHLTTVNRPAFACDEVTVFGFDYGNVLGQIADVSIACLPNAKGAIEAAVRSWHASALFFLDHAASFWLRRVCSPAAADKLLREFKSANATWTDGPADIPLLQTVRALGPKAVPVSRDRFGEYMGTWKTEILRRHSFTTIGLPSGGCVLNVAGTPAGIEIPAFVEGSEASVQ